METCSLHSRVGQWGSSCAVRLPKMAVETLDLRAGAPITISIEEGAIVIRRDRPQYRLDAMIAQARGLTPPDSLDDAPAGREEL